MCGTCKPIHKLSNVQLVPDYTGGIRAVGVLVHDDLERGFKAGTTLQTSALRDVQGTRLVTRSGTLYEVVA